MSKIYHPDHGMLINDGSQAIKEILKEGGELVECGNNEFQKILENRKRGKDTMRKHTLKTAPGSEQDNRVADLQKQLTERDTTIEQLELRIKELEAEKRPDNKDNYYVISGPPDAPQDSDMQSPINSPSEELDNLKKPVKKSNPKAPELNDLIS